MKIGEWVQKVWRLRSVRGCEDRLVRKGTHDAYTPPFILYCEGLLLGDSTRGFDAGGEMRNRAVELGKNVQRVGLS